MLREGIRVAEAQKGGELSHCSLRNAGTAKYVFINEVPSSLSTFLFSETAQTSANSGTFTKHT